MSEPFFSRIDVQRAVQDVAAWNNITIYVGAGASIDRTGLSWAGLVNGLLEPVIADAGSRRTAIETLGPIAAATSAIELIGRQAAAHADERLAERLRLLLYGSGAATAGQITENVVELAISWWLEGKSVCLVTPNYDDFLLQEFENFGLPSEYIKHLVVKNRSSARGLRAQLSSDCITLVHLHGYLPESRTGRRSDIPPVVSEIDYFNTIPRSRKALRTLFTDRNILLVGTSLTDPPLLRALHETRDETHRGGSTRLLVSPLQGSNRPGQAGDHQAVQRILDARSDALGIRTIYCDYYIQVGQFLEEVNSCVVHEHEDYSDLLAPHRYGTRLADWWRDWSTGTGLTKKWQKKHHRFLRRQLELVRETFDVPLSEALKLELWIRWRPDRGERRLRLWASSTGTWPDTASMRDDVISAGSRYASVRAFCRGAPSFYPAELPEGYEHRWSSYLSVPLWVRHIRGDIPVGVITIASMQDAEGGLVAQSNPAATAALIPLLRQAGDMMVFPRPRTQDDDAYGT
jgi:hypothetical protein